MRSKLLNYLKFFIGWPLSIIAIIFLFKIVAPNFSQVLISLKNTNFLILSIGIIFFITYFYLRAFLWQKILELQGYKLEFKETSRMWAISELKRYIPGNIWSFIGRAHLFNKKNIAKKDILFSLLIEAEVIVISLLIVSLLGGSILFNYFSNISANFYYIIVGLIVFVYALNSLLVKKINLNLINKFASLFLPEFNYIDNLNLILIGVVSFIFFGLGNYFTLASILYLDPRLFLFFLGVFNFSLLIGYLSLITPVGLGIREGILVIFLSKTMSSSIVGFAAVFSRIILIISELLFVVITLTLDKIKHKIYLKAENFLFVHKHEVILVIFVLLYVVYFTTVSFLRHDNFYTGRFDLGNMDQTVWNTINGRIFQFTDPDNTNIVSRLSYHADFILILLSPLYLIWSNPKMLLLVQTIVLACGAIFVYLLSRKIIKNKNISLTLSFVYLLNPSLQFVNLFDFHPVALATTFLLGAFYFLSVKRFFLFILFAILAALTKEQIWVIIAFFGIYIIFNNFFYLKKYILNVKSFLFGSVIFTFSIIIFYALVSYVIPNSRGSEHFALGYFSDFGDSPNAIIKNVIFYPQKTLGTIFQAERVEYLKQLFMPVGSLPLIFPLGLVFAMPDLLINLLSNNAQLHQIYYQYTSSITPFIFISTIYALALIIKRFHKIPITFLALYLILASIYSSYEFGPMPGAKRQNIDMFTKSLSYKEEIESFLSNIPKEYKIAASNNVGAHVSQRENIYTIPLGIDEADIIVFLLNDPYAQPSLEAQKKMSEKLKRDENYIKIFEKKDFVAFKKK